MSFIAHLRQELRAGMLTILAVLSIGTRRKHLKARVKYSALWRRVSRALVQVLACLACRDARPAGSGADVGDRRVHGVLPEVVGLPRGDLIKQVRFGPAVDSCCGQDRVLELCVLPSAEGCLGQEPLARSPWSASPSTQAYRTGRSAPSSGSTKQESETFSSADVSTSARLCSRVVGAMFAESGHTLVR